MNYYSQQHEKAGFRLHIFASFGVLEFVTLILFSNRSLLYTIIEMVDVPNLNK